jgi:hypothetical protein
MVLHLSGHQSYRQTTWPKRSHISTWARLLQPNCTQEPIFYSAVYSPIRINAGTWLIHPINSLVCLTHGYFENSPSSISSIHLFPRLTLQIAIFLPTTKSLNLQINVLKTALSQFFYSIKLFTSTANSYIFEENICHNHFALYNKKQ